MYHVLALLVLPKSRNEAKLGIIDSAGSLEGKTQQRRSKVARQHSDLASIYLARCTAFSLATT